MVLLTYFIDYDMCDILQLVTRTETAQDDTSRAEQELRSVGLFVLASNSIADRAVLESLSGDPRGDS